VWLVDERPDSWRPNRRRQADGHSGVGHGGMARHGVRASARHVEFQAAPRQVAERSVVLRCFFCNRERMEFFLDSMLGCNAIGTKSTGYVVAHPAYPVATPPTHHCSGVTLCRHSVRSRVGWHTQTVMRLQIRLV
jgi:hypothetical protein